jgi:hypothetical protein
LHPETLQRQREPHDGESPHGHGTAAMKYASLATPWRLKWYSIAMLFGIFSAMVIVLLSGTGPKILSGRLGGDFPPFYAVGHMVATSGFNELYDIAQQIETQKDLFPDHRSVLPFPYPPFVALACVPLSWFPYRIAYVLHLFVNMSAFFVAFVCIKKVIRVVDDFFLPVFTFSLTFYPFLIGTLNGQLTAIIFMLFALVWRLTMEERVYWAGFFMGLLLFKPQFAIPLIGVFMLSGRMKIAFSAIGTGCLIISISLFFTGIQTYYQWYHFLKWFVPADATVNGHNAVSWIGFLDAVFGTRNSITFMIGCLCCFATVLVISYIWAVGGTKSDFNAQMGLAAVSFVLIPPHVMYYDAGLIVLTYAVIISKMHERQIELICFVWLAGMTQIFADKIGFSPLFFLVVFTFFLSLGHIAAPAMRKKRELLIKIS